MRLLSNKYYHCPRSNLVRIVTLNFAESTENLRTYSANNKDITKCFSPVLTQGIDLKQSIARRGLKQIILNEVIILRNI